MPGFDRTGPGGYGSMTGWRRGRCNPAGNYNPYGGGPGMGRGFGGRRRGMPMGQGFGGFQQFADYPPPETYDLNSLKAEEVRLKSALDNISARISELKKTPR